MATSSEISFTFACGLRGYHVYQTVWTPTLNESLPTIHESDNDKDCYAIAARKRLPGSALLESTVGHLPKEISRITRFIMLHGAIVTAKVMDTHHRRSPLVQGGLEIPIEVTVTMKYSPDNKDAMVKYEDLVGKHYKEPVDGKYEDITPEILEGLESDTDEETIDKGEEGLETGRRT